MKPVKTIRSQYVRSILFAMLFSAGLSAWAQSGTWTNLAGGSWATTVNWNSGTIASGADNTADFSTLDLTANATVTLDGARTIGNLVFGDTAPSHNWVLNTGSAGPLTLAVTAGSPLLNAVSGSNTIGAVIASSSGFTKFGTGTVRLGASNPNLQGLIIVSNGLLQIGNATAAGTNGNQNFSDRVIVTNGATLEVIPALAINNKHLTISGTGFGGTMGAIYANPATNTSSTRWGLSSINDSGTSANSSASFPAITLAGDSTIRVDGLNWTYTMLVGYITSGTSNYTLTKIGAGRISLDRGANLSNIVVNAGSVAPNSASGFGAVQNWTVNSGATIYTWQNGSYGSGASMTVNAGGVWDINGRSDSAGTGYTENIGYLSGSGTITHGSLGATVSTILAINNNSSFSGPVTTANGILNVTKNTAGTTLTFSGTNTYNGVTTINGGTVLVDGIHTGGSNYVVNANGTLGGRGTILPGSGSAISLSGTLVAGDAGGTLTVSNVTGSGSVIVSNANLSVKGSFGSVSGYLGSLYLTNATLTLPLLGSGASAFASTVAVDGNVTLAYTNSNPTTGQFPLIAYSTLTGLAGGGTNGITLVPPAGTTAYLSNNAANSTLDVVVTAIPALAWNGNVNGNWDLGSTANWLNGATPSTYTETAGLGPFVIFDDSATGTPSVNVAANVTPRGITLNSSSKNYTFSGGGQIGGSGSVVKSGSSTLTIANTNALSGTFTINNGTVSIGNGGASGDVGSASIVNNSQLVFNRSDNVTFANAISGSGSLGKQGAGMVTLSGIGNVSNPITISAGALALAPAGSITVSGDVTGGGAFGVNGAGTVILNSGNVAYTGGTIISNGTLQLNAAFPPSGNISDYGTLAIGTGGTLANNVSGTGGLTLLSGAGVTLGGANTYSGPTRVLGGAALITAAANYPSGSPLVLGSITGAADTGYGTFTSGNPVIGGLAAGGNSTSPGDPLTFMDNGQTLTINGNVSVGNSGPSGASVYLPATGSGVSIVVNTNGGTIQIGLGTAGSGVNPDAVFVDFSGIDNFVANLGSTGLVNLGTTDGNPGPPGGASVVNWFNLASVSNYITAGAINIGAGGRQLTPELRLGAGTNILNVNTLALGPGQGTGGRDGGYLHFLGGTGGLRLRANDGVSRATFNVGVNPITATGANLTNTVDLTAHPVDLLVSNLVIGDYNNGGIYQNTFSFDTGTLDALFTSLSVIRNNNGNAAASGSTLNINGGTARLGPVSLTASAAYGTLNVANATLSTANIVAPGSGVSTFSIANSSWNLTVTNIGNPVTAPVFAKSFSASGTINLGVNGTNWTVGQFPLVSYTGSIGGDGYSALNLTSLPSGVGGYLSNNVANLSVDLVVTNAPSLINPNPTNILVSVSGNQITLSWPASHIGWLLQSNGVSLLNTGAWITVSGSSATNQFTYGVDPARTNVFFRMLKP